MADPIAFQVSPDHILNAPTSNTRTKQQRKSVTFRIGIEKHKHTRTRTEEKEMNSCKTHLKMAFLQLIEKRSKLAGRLVA